MRSDRRRRSYSKNQRRDHRTSSGHTAKTSNNPDGYPSHTEFYKNFHRIDQLVLQTIFAQMGWTYLVPEQKKLIRTIPAQTTEFDYTFEHGGWDIVFSITNTPEKKLDIVSFVPDRSIANSMRMNGNTHGSLYLEYKSSLREWGKQFDEHIRQIKYRDKGFGLRILISFDPEFAEYENVAERSGFLIIILPRLLLNMLRAKTDDEALHILEKEIAEQTE